MSLRNLNLNSSGLVALPPSISALAPLKILFLNGNTLTRLPAELSNLQCLEVGVLSVAQYDVAHIVPWDKLTSRLHDAAFILFANLGRALGSSYLTMSSWKYGGSRRCSAGTHSAYTLQ